MGRLFLIIWMSPIQSHKSLKSENLLFPTTVSGTCSLKKGTESFKTAGFEDGRRPWAKNVGSFQMLGKGKAMGSPIELPERKAALKTHYFGLSTYRTLLLLYSSLFSMLPLQRYFLDYPNYGITILVPSKQSYKEMPLVQTLRTNIL